MYKLDNKLIFKEKLENEGLIYKVADMLDFSKKIKIKILEIISEIDNRDTNSTIEYQLMIPRFKTQIYKYIQKTAQENFPECSLYFSNDKSSINEQDKKYRMIINVEDSIFPTISGFEMSTVSIAIMPFLPIITVPDILQSFVYELKSEAWLYADQKFDGIIWNGFSGYIPNPNLNASTEDMRWILEIYNNKSIYDNNIWKNVQKLIEANKSGRLYVFNSPTFSILKVISGQVDAYINIDNNVVTDDSNNKLNANQAYLFAPIFFIANKANLLITNTNHHFVVNKDIFSEEFKSDCIIATPILHAKISSLLC